MKREREKLPHVCWPVANEQGMRVVKVSSGGRWAFNAVVVVGRIFYARTYGVGLPLS